MILRKKKQNKIYEKMGLARTVKLKLILIFLTVIFLENFFGLGNWLWEQNQASK